MSDPILAEKTLSTSDKYIKVHGGLHYIKGNRKPYFTITADMYRSGGCQHDSIKQYFGKRFNSLIEMHLSDIDGVPMHAVENGWYWMGRTGYQKAEPETLAKHLRIDMEAAVELCRDEVLSKADFAAIVEELKPRWKEEAIETIEKYNLTVYGDKYEEA